MTSPEMTDLTDIALQAVLDRVGSGSSTDDDAKWLRTHIARLRELLRYVWWQTSGDKLHDRIDGEAMLRCYLRADIMRQVAALFVEEKADDSLS